MNITLIRSDDASDCVAAHGAVKTRALGPLEEPFAALLGPDAYRRQTSHDLSDADSSGIGWFLAELPAWPKPASLRSCK